MMKFAFLAIALLMAAAEGCENQEKANPRKSPPSAQVTSLPDRPAPFPDRPAARAISGNVEFCDIAIDGSGPGRPMHLNLYLPAGKHDAKSLSCVLIAPAGSGMHGMVIGDSDRAEHFPYVRAGFAVMAYELSGDLPNSRGRHTYAEMIGPVTRFMEADGGLINGRVAIDYVLEKVPEVDPDRLLACGHSSAAVVALNFAAGDSRIRACCAYAPCTDVEAWWNDPKMDQVIPGFSAFATRKSPLRHVQEIKCPVYLFHADDDSMVALADNQAFANAVRAAGKKITFDRVETGDHYDSMIKEGIPRGIKFMNSFGPRDSTRHKGKP